MNQLLSKIIEYLTYKEKKKEAIKYQNYAVAALSRDIERQLSLDIYMILNKEPLDNKQLNNWALFENEINEYLIKTYGVGINSSSDLSNIIKKLHRENIFKELDI